LAGGIFWPPGCRSIRAIKAPTTFCISFIVVVLFAVTVGATPSLGAGGNNLIANPSVETAVTGVPANWTHVEVSTSTAAFNYLSSGHTGSRSVQVVMTNRSGGQAYWASAPVTISPSTKYTFTDWYQSNVSTTVAIATTTSAGTTNTTTVAEPPSATWRQASVSFTTGAAAVSLTVRQYIGHVGQLTTDDYDLEGPAPVAPTVKLTAPAANATVKGTQALTATATDAAGVQGVQFAIDGVNRGAQDTAAPYSVNWDTTQVANGPHTVSATATGAGLATTVSETVVVKNVVAAPTVAISSPANNAVVGGSQAISATASDPHGVTRVQFELNGTALGGPMTAAPYTYTWDTTTVTNGSYVLTAVATNHAGLTSTSAAVTVNVQNQSAGGGDGSGGGPNIVLNASAEAAAADATPADWESTGWGTHTTTFSYLRTGHTGRRSLEVQTTAWASGAAEWYYADLPVTPGATYHYSNWYRANVATEVDAEVVMTDGTTNYYYLGAVPASQTWNQFTTTFTPPTGAQAIAIYQTLAKVGYLITDDYSLSAYVPPQFARGIVSLDFDDGWLDQYTAAVPALQANDLTATFYIITDQSITNPNPVCMNVADLQSLIADGYEIGNHTETHPDLTTLTSAQVQSEMRGAQAVFQASLGITPTDFAYPYGTYNASTIAIGQQAGFVSQRSVDAGFNAKDSIDFTQLKVEEVTAETTPAEVDAWVDQAIADRTWLILLYHRIDAQASPGAGDEDEVTTPANLDAELSYIGSSGAAVETTAQAIGEIKAQL
jgi:peptidoglycan/xylan/chitin deacetylase (PgdA/CDA1 family)